MKRRPPPVGIAGEQEYVVRCACGVWIDVRYVVHEPSGTGPCVRRDPARRRLGARVRTLATDVSEARGTAEPGGRGLEGRILARLE